MNSVKRTFRENFKEWCERIGIDQSSIEIFEERADRVYFNDPTAKILIRGLAHDWADSKPTNHGPSVVLSLRERTRPSLQLCVHRRLDAVTGQRDLWYEVDFDKHPPIDPVNTVGHIAEVAENKITQSTTDQDEIAAGLQKRWET